MLKNYIPALRYGNLVGADEIEAGAIGQSALNIEVATLTFGAADTSKTATVAAGDIVLGCYVSAFTATPNQGELSLAISGTTLTGTRSAAPGTSNGVVYKVILLKA